jgi:hypothetical protein
MLDSERMSSNILPRMEAALKRATELNTSFEGLGKKSRRICYTPPYEAGYCMVQKSIALKKQGAYRLPVECGYADVTR